MLDTSYFQKICFSFDDRNAANEHTPPEEENHWNNNTNTGG